MLSKLKKGKADAKSETPILTDAQLASKMALGMELIVEDTRKVRDQLRDMTTQRDELEERAANLQMLLDAARRDAAGLRRQLQMPPTAGGLVDMRRAADVMVILPLRRVEAIIAESLSRAGIGVTRRPTIHELGHDIMRRLRDVMLTTRMEMPPSEPTVEFRIGADDVYMTNAMNPYQWNVSTGHQMQTATLATGQIVASQIEAQVRAQAEMNRGIDQALRNINLNDIDIGVPPEPGNDQPRNV